MGLFSSDTVTKVSTSVMRVMEDSALPDTNKRSITQSLLGKNSGSLAENLVSDILNGPVINMDRYYEVAKKGDYVFGLPNTHVKNRNQGSSEIQSAIENEVGEPVTLDYSEFAPLDPIHAGWKHITENHGYNPSSNELEGLSASVGHTVYLSNLKPVFGTKIVDMEPGVADTFADNPHAGYTPERKGQGPGSTMGQYRMEPTPVTDETKPKSVVVEWVWEDSAGTLQRDSETVDLSGYDREAEYFQAKYVTDSGDTGYWIYQDNSGTYPAVDALMRADYTNPGTYFPFVLFRHHRENRTAEDLRNTEEFKSTQNLLDTIGMDFASMGESIHENPDIDKVEQAVMMMAVKADSTNKADLRYLWNFFAWLHSQSPEDTVTADEYKKVPKTDNAIVWRDADYHITLSYGPIKRRIRSGSIGPVGAYGTATDSYTVSKTTETQTGGPDGGWETTTYTQTVDVQIYRKQISESMYDEIRITSPSMRYDIWNGYEYLAGSDSDQLIIPLDKSITDSYDIQVKEELYYRSLMFVFNSRITETVKWYESGLFQFVLTAVAIVITVYSFGATAASIGASIAAGSYTAAAITVLQTLVVSIAVKEGFKVLVKELGLENSFAVAVLAVAVAAISGQSETAAQYLPTASEMLWAVNGLMSGFNAYISDVMEDYNAQNKEFELLKEEKTEELEKAAELLKVDTLLNPFEFVGRSPAIIEGESPDAFYQRVAHTPNPTRLSLKSVESYVENSIKLPTIDETLRRFS